MKNITICLGLISSLFVCGVHAHQHTQARHELKRVAVAVAPDGCVFKKYVEGRRVFYSSGAGNKHGIRVVGKDIDVMTPSGVAVGFPQADAPSLQAFDASRKKPLQFTRKKN